MGITNFDIVQANGFIGMQIPAGGNVFYVKPYTGSNGNTGRSPNKAFKTLAKALSVATAGNNDVIYMIAESVTGTLTTDFQTTTLTWNKDMVHLIGINNGICMSPRSRISAISTYASAAPTMSVTAGGCYFANLQILMDAVDTTPLGALSVSGIRNRFDNCHIYGMVYATNDILGAYSVLLTAAEEIEFHGCTFGNDRTQLGAYANSQIKIAAASKNILFKDCMVKCCTSHATNHQYLRAAAGSLEGAVVFRNTVGVNSQSRGTAPASIEMTCAFTVAADSGGDVIVDATSAFQASDLNASDAGNVYALGAGGGILVPAVR